MGLAFRSLLVVLCARSGTAIVLRQGHTHLHDHNHTHNHNSACVDTTYDSVADMVNDGWTVNAVNQIKGGANCGDPDVDWQFSTNSVAEATAEKTLTGSGYLTVSVHSLCPDYSSTHGPGTTTSLDAQVLGVQNPRGTATYANIPFTNGQVLQVKETVDNTAVLSLRLCTGGSSVSGDPHLVNMLGEQFDILQRGTHVLLQIPRGADPEHALLRVTANITGGKSCDYTFMTGVSFTGKWIGARKERTDTIQYNALPWGKGGKRSAPTHWLRAGPVQLRVAQGMMASGLTYLNLKVNHLREVNESVGGLLGLDDHTRESSKEKCVPDLAYVNVSRDEEVEAGSGTIKADEV